MNRRDRQRAAALERREPVVRSQRRPIEANIILCEEQLALTEAALCGDLWAAQIVQALVGWRERAGSSDLSPQCINCNVLFAGAIQPAAFAFAHVIDDGVAIVTGICEGCREQAERELGLLAMAVRRWRELWPDLMTVSPTTSRSQ
jgi:hypothetical protein